MWIEPIFSPGKMVLGKSVPGKMVPRKLVPGKMVPEILVRGKMVPGKISFKIVLRRKNARNDFFIFIDWFHYTHIYKDVWRSPNCRILKESRKVCCRVLGFHRLITSQNSTQTPRCSTLTPRFFTFSSHTEYVKRESIITAWVKKKFSPFEKCSWFVCLRRQNKQKKSPSVCLSVCLDVWIYVRTWTFHVDKITFEGVANPKKI